MDVSQAQGPGCLESIYSFVSDTCDLVYTNLGVSVGGSLNHLNSQLVVKIEAFRVSAFVCIFEMSLFALCL